jgi:hypothetical protein
MNTLRPGQPATALSRRECLALTGAGGFTVFIAS